jgi:hypothetical protein
VRARLAVVGTCLAGCLASPPAGSGLPSGEDAAPVDARPGDAGVAMACAQPSLVTDRFEDTLVGPGFVATSDGTATVTMPGDEAILDLNTSGWATLATYRAFGLYDAEAHVEVPEIPNLATSARFSFIAKHDDDNIVRFTLESDNLSATFSTPDETTTVKTGPYDALDHRWWRLREEAGTTYWETSSDGAVWVTFAEAPTRVALRYVRIVFFASIDDLGEDGGQVRLDNYNGGGVATGSWCPAATMAEDFASTDSEPGWMTIAGTDCEISRASGELDFALAFGMDTSCYHVARPRFDLTGSSVAVEMIEAMEASEDALSSLRVGPDDENWLEMRVQGGQVKAVKSVDSVSSPVWMDDYLPAMHSQMRIREASGTVYFDTSDGQTWSSVADIPVPFDLDAVEVRLAVVVVGLPLTTGRTVRFDHYNEGLPP